MKTIFFLSHEYETETHDVYTEIAVYSTKEKAESGLQKFLKHPYFLKHCGEFTIDEYEIGNGSWTEGFFITE